MRIVVTGATGFIGCQLVPVLKQRGAKLLLVGRDVRRLKSLFPGEMAFGYEQFVEHALGYDALVHLAVHNNDAPGTIDDFLKINVDFMLETLSRAREAGIQRFVNISSIHALDKNNDTFYAQSKRIAVDHLSRAEGIRVTTLYLPSVYSRQWAGKFAFLNRLPSGLARTIFVPLQALTPTAHVKELARSLSEGELARSKETVVSDTQRNNPVFSVCKRMLDITFALSVAALFWWALLIIWVLIKLDSPGPGIFSQVRIGQHGRNFTCYKFRTMKLGTAQAATHELSIAAVTPLGRFLRKTKLDELPQILNILFNNLSLVGPRPCLPVQTELIQARTNLDVLSIKPGITGLAQINGIDMSDPTKLARTDQRYLALQSLILDLKIISATATGKGRGDRTKAPS